MASKLINKNNFYKRFNIYKKLETLFINKLINRDIYIPHGLYSKCEKKIFSNSIIHSKCLISGRSRANINKFKMSRMIFKKYSEFGFLNGIRKSSW